MSDLALEQWLVAEAIAIVSIVSGAAVAVLVPFINARLERSRILEQRRDVRLDELRGLLDDALQHLYVAGTILYEIDEEAARDLPRPSWSEKRLLQLGAQLTEQSDVVNQDALRIRLRTPQGAAVFAAYQESVNAILRFERDYRGFIESDLRDQEKPPPTPLDEIRLAVGKVVTEVRAFVGIVDAPVQMR